MAKTGYVSEIKHELAWIFKKPHTQLNSILVNAVISLGFFVFSLVLGTTNPKVLPFAAAVVLLWTIADASITNQFMYDKKRSKDLLKNSDSLYRPLIIRNVTVVILTIPLCIIFGLLMVAILGKWSELIYGLALALSLVWGWLGISNFLSVYFPFEQLNTKQVIKRDDGWKRYVILYVMPWLILPVYVLIIILFLKLVHVITGNLASSHIILSSLVVLGISLVIWVVGLLLANKSSERKNKLLVNYLDK